MCAYICECSQEREIIGLQGKVDVRHLPKPKFAQALNVTDDQGFNSLDWQGLVEIYSSLELSVESDILTAFSGVARVIQEQTNDVYLAGLWKVQLLKQSCWYSTGETQERPGAWHAPSWSWASKKGGVQFWAPHSASGDSFLHLGEILDSSCEQVTDTPTGQVSSGFIVLSGTLHSLDQLSNPHPMYGKRLFPWFDSLRDKNALETGTLLWFMPIASLQRWFSNGSWEIGCIIFKETQTEANAIPNFNVEMIEKQAEMGKGAIHPYAMERVGFLELDDSRWISKVKMVPEHIVVII
jgi:hypothetical protein